MSSVGPGVDPRRVAQLRIEHSDGSRRGSGYRVTDTEVLTAAHVVKESRSVSVVFNADLPEQWAVPATVRLCEQAGDVAVLTIDPPAEQRGVEPARFGRLDRRAERVSCRLVGFPRFKLRSYPRIGLDTATAAAAYRDVHQADGTIATLSNWREGTLEITVVAPEQDPDSRLSPWEGMSGAAVWCADLIVGVVSVHHGNEGLNRLAAVRVALWYEQLDVDKLIELRDLLGLPDQGDALDDAISAEAAWRLAAASPGRMRRRLGTLDKEREDEIARWFVNPRGWDEAVSALRSSGIVLLHGETGGGRRTAAIRLLGEHGRRIRPIRQLSPQPDEPGDPGLDPEDVAEDDRLMLDLSADEDRFAAIVGELSGFRRTVRERRAALVILLPARAEHLLRQQLGAPVVEVGRPNGGKVFEAHLSVLGVQNDGSKPTKPLAEVLAHGSMQDIEHLAWLVHEARKRSDSPSFAEWLNQALTAHSDRARKVAEQVAQHADGHFRAMLLVSAMLEGRGPEDVFKAKQLLLQALHFNNGLVHELEQPGLRARFAEIGVESDGHSGIQFTELNYAAAVRKHFWTNFPGLRDGFRDWVIECGRQMQYSGDQGEQFVHRYASECLRTLRPDDLIETIEKWTLEDPVQTELASSALEFGLADPRQGGTFRRKCYYWSINPNLPWPLAYVVIAACIHVIAPNHPNQALVRLHHLARNRDDGVAESARVKLLTLTEDRRLFRRLLARLTDPVRSRLEDPRERSLFLAVADAGRLAATTDFGRPLIVESAVRRQLVVGWRAVFSAGRKPEYVDYVWQWLGAYSASRQQDLLTVLLEACGAEFAHLATLYAMGRRWLRRREGRAEDAVAHQTIQRLDSSIDAAFKAIGAY